MCLIGNAWGLLAFPKNIFYSWSSTSDEWKMYLAAFYKWGICEANIAQSSLMERLAHGFGTGTEMFSEILGRL